MWCVSTASMSSMIVNGSPCEPFKFQKGLRQGDPISSFLFNIVSKALNFVISEACSKDLIFGIRNGRDNIELTHLQYADDTLLFFLRIPIRC